MDATRYLNSVAWRTHSRNVILLTEETTLDPATYRVSVSAIDVNEPGAELAEKEIGYFYKDYIGHTYSIIAKTVNTIDISDDFRCQQGPQSGLQAIVYKSVWKGRSPYLAPVYYRHLDKVAVDYSRQIEIDILWSNDPNAIKVSFTNTSTPSLINYQALYAWDYGELPKIELFTMDSSNVYWSRQEKPIFNFIGGLIDSIVFDLSDTYTGYIVISK
jgi:hypothetical protein